MDLRAAIVKTTGEVQFVEIKTAAVNAAKEIRIRKAGMEILIPTNLDAVQVQMWNILSVLVAIENRPSRNKTGSSYPTVDSRCVLNE